MSLENKKPEFIQRLTLKKVVVSLGGVIAGVSLVAFAGISLFSSKDDSTKSIDYKNSNPLKYSEDMSDNDKVDKLIKKEDASDPYTSIVDPGVANILSSNQPNSNYSNGSNLSNGNKPLYSIDNQYAYKDNFDWDHASDAEIRAYVEKQEGQKVVKIGTYTTITDTNGNNDWRKSANQPQQPTTASLGQGTPNSNQANIPLVFDSMGNQILGWDSNGNPIIGYDKNGKPIMGKNPNGIIGYDSNGKALTKNDLAKSLSFDSNYAKKNILYDKNGNVITGYDANGNPIIGYDKNGKPILGVTENGVMGYDANGKALTKMDLENNLYKTSGLKLLDKNGKPIIGWDTNGNPIVGYDSNGKPILGLVDKGVAGYDSNGKPILRKNLDNLLVQKNLSENLQNNVLRDKDGKQILGWDTNGNPIISYDKNGRPIYGRVDKGIAGYDANGNPITKENLQAYLKKNAADDIISKSNRPTLYDKNGNLIIGYDSTGKPIIGYDSTGKPIYGSVDKGVAGYDVNGNPILKKDLAQYMSSNGASFSKATKPLLYDKNHQQILGWDSNGNPIVGYDKNGKAILGKVDQGIAGYDSNGNPISQNNLQGYLNSSQSPANAIDNIAGVGSFGNSSVPPLNGYQPQQSNVVNIEPKNISGGSSFNSGSTGVQFNAKSLTKQKESNPWDEQVSKTNSEADKAQLTINLNYKTPESQTIQQSAINPKNTSGDSNIESNSNANNEAKDIQPLQYVKLNSRYTAKAGTFIPMLMQTGINSDLPGPILGKVSTNVYDTATGKYLLIPQGSTLFGSYSANISYGQTRILIAWNKLILPNGDEVKLAGQPGTDLEGFAGLNDQVNNHYWSLFGNTFILSAITAGLEYNQSGSQNSMNNGSSFSSSLSNSSGQMMGQAAAGVLQKSINIAPTLTIRNGFRGNVILTQDLTLPSPYKMKLYNPYN